MITGILTGFTDSKSATGVLLRMVSGLFLCIIAVSPMADLDLSYLTDFVETFEESAQTAAAVGTSMADDALRQIIKTETEAYILDKASIYGAEIHVDVELSEDEIPCPVGVTINGVYDAAIQRDLQNMIEAELGITKERQKWNGQY